MSLQPGSAAPDLQEPLRIDIAAEAGRDPGRGGVKPIRLRTAERVSAGLVTVWDFANVRTLCEGTADELVAVLAVELGPDRFREFVHVENLKDHHMDQVVVAYRLRRESGVSSDITEDPPGVIRKRPFFQPGYKKPEPWGTEPWVRGSHLCVCDVCGREYRLHPMEFGPAYGSAGDERIELMRLCDGSLIKP